MLQKIIITIHVLRFVQNNKGIQAVFNIISVNIIYYMKLIITCTQAMLMLFHEKTSFEKKKY